MPLFLPTMVYQLPALSEIQTQISRDLQKAGYTLTRTEGLRLRLTHPLLPEGLTLTFKEEDSPTGKRESATLELTLDISEPLAQAERRLGPTVLAELPKPGVSLLCVHQFSAHPTDPGRSRLLIRTTTTWAFTLLEGWVARDADTLRRTVGSLKKAIAAPSSAPDAPQKEPLAQRLDATGLSYTSSSSGISYLLTFGTQTLMVSRQAVLASGLKTHVIYTNIWTGSTPPSGDLLRKYCTQSKKLGAFYVYQGTNGMWAIRFGVHFDPDASDPANTLRSLISFVKQVGEESVSRASAAPPQTTYFGKEQKLLAKLSPNPLSILVRCPEHLPQHSPASPQLPGIYSGEGR